MKASELAFGDWVMPLRKSIRKPCQVVSIDGGTNTCWIDSDEYSGLLSCSDLERIPLSTEILEKNGFHYNDLPFVQSWEQFGLSLHLGGNGYRINCGQNVAIVIDSVHQLQHALRLCGIEKDITL